MARAAGTIKGPVIITAGIARLRRDFEAMIPEARGEVRQVIRSAVQPVAAAARRRMPLGDDRVSAGASSAHIRDTIVGRVRGDRGVVMTRHPGARANEFGDTISPKGAPITLPERSMLRGALTQQAPVVIRAIEVGFERLARRHGFH